MNLQNPRDYAKQREKDVNAKVNGAAAADWNSIIWKL
jgi:hypothetical protein